MNWKYLKKKYLLHEAIEEQMTAVKRVEKKKIKLKVEIVGNNNLSQEHMKEIKIVFSKSIDLLTSSVLNINKIKNHVLFEVRLTKQNIQR